MKAECLSMVVKLDLNDQGLMAGNAGAEQDRSNVTRTVALQIDFPR